MASVGTISCNGRGNLKQLRVRRAYVRCSSWKTRENGTSLDHGDDPCTYIYIYILDPCRSLLSFGFVGFFIDHFHFHGRRKEKKASLLFLFVSFLLLLLLLRFEEINFYSSSSNSSLIFYIQFLASDFVLFKSQSEIRIIFDPRGEIVRESKRETNGTFTIDRRFSQLVFA